MSILHRQWPATRMRRLRRTGFIRELVRENSLSSSDLIWPLFIMEGQKRSEPISAMPGCQRQTIDRALETAKQAQDLGIRAVTFFPVIPAELKSARGEACLNPDGLIQKTVQAFKTALPDMLVITDIALDPYTSHGQDGVTDQSGNVLNDETVKILTQQALSHAEAGADIVAPSDMMDGRIGAIRSALEQAEYQDTLILAYSAKYASAWFAPFRSAIGSDSALAAGDKRSYQMDPGNAREALQECALDLQEGADIIMVKPALPYLDIIHSVSHELKVPVFAYQVSGEYTMLQALDDRTDSAAVVLESLLCIKRAGASAILTYFAPLAAQLLADT